MRLYVAVTLAAKGGGPKIADMLGCSRQRVHQLLKRPLA